MIKFVDLLLVAFLHSLPVIRAPLPDICIRCFPFEIPLMKWINSLTFGLFECMYQQCPLLVIRDGLSSASVSGRRIWGHKFSFGLARTWGTLICGNVPTITRIQVSNAFTSCDYVFCIQRAGRFKSSYLQLPVRAREVSKSWERASFLVCYRLQTLRPFVGSAFVLCDEVNCYITLY